MNITTEQPEALRLADALDRLGFLGTTATEAADELRRLHLYAAGADQLVEVWKCRAQDFMNSRDRLLKAKRSLWAKMDSLRAGLLQPAVCWQWICEYPGDVFVVFDPMTDGAHIIGAARTLREAGEILGAVGQEPQREPMTDARIDAIAEAMPGGLEGFLKGWGWRQFARAVIAEYEGAQQPPKVENSAVVFTAPQGWGKTRDAKHLLKLFGLDRLVEDWMPGMPIQDRTLHLTNVPPDELERLHLSCRVFAKGWPGRAMPPKDETAPGGIR